MYRGTFRSMGNLAAVLVLAMLFSGIWFTVSDNNRGIAPIVSTATQATTLPLMGNMAVVFPNQIGAVGKYTFHPPTDFAVGINVDSIITLEARWGVPKAKDFYFVEPANWATMYKISTDGGSVTLTGGEEVFANMALLTYWCRNSSITISEETCNGETQGLIRAWWPNNFFGVTPATWLKEPILTLVPTENRANGTVTVPTASP